tara:strand:+ start:32601 stop:32909 length:309 start_codon:yes stop_codon:yes gene_type:complete
VSALGLSILHVRWIRGSSIQVQIALFMQRTLFFLQLMLWSCCLGDLRAFSVDILCQSIYIFVAKLGINENLESLLRATLLHQQEIGDPVFRVSFEGIFERLA